MAHGNFLFCEILCYKPCKHDPYLKGWISFLYGLLVFVSGSRDAYGQWSVFIRGGVAARNSKWYSFPNYFNQHSKYAKTVHNQFSVSAIS